MLSVPFLMTSLFMAREQIMSVKVFIWV
jgi:hypothetical protein